MKGIVNMEFFFDFEDKKERHDFNQMAYCETVK